MRSVNRLTAESIEALLRVRPRGGIHACIVADAWVTLNSRDDFRELLFNAWAHLLGPRASYAYVLIRERIMSCDMAPGQDFTASALAETLNMSRTPLQEALKALGVEGLVEVLPQVGHGVATFSAADISNWYEVRIALEHQAPALPWKGQKGTPWEPSLRFLPVVIVEYRAPLLA